MKMALEQCLPVFCNWGESTDWLSPRESYGGVRKNKHDSHNLCDLIWIWMGIEGGDHNNQSRLWTYWKIIKICNGFKVDKEQVYSVVQKDETGVLYQLMSFLNLISEYGFHSTASFNWIRVGVCLFSTLPIKDSFMRMIWSQFREVQYFIIRISFII